MCMHVIKAAVLISDTADTCAVVWPAVCSAFSTVLLELMSAWLHDITGAAG